MHWTDTGNKTPDSHNRIHSNANSMQYKTKKRKGKKKTMKEEEKGKNCITKMHTDTDTKGLYKRLDSNVNSMQYKDRGIYLTTPPLIFFFISLYVCIWVKNIINPWFHPWFLLFPFSPLQYSPIFPFFTFFLKTKLENIYSCIKTGKIGQEKNKKLNCIEMCTDTNKLLYSR